MRLSEDIHAAGGIEAIGFSLVKGCSILAVFAVAIHCTFKIREWAKDRSF